MIQKLEQQCAAIMQRAVEEQFAAGCCLMVFQNGRNILSCQAGWRDMEKGLPMTPDTILRLYSMTKPITGAAVMLLTEQGVLDLYDPVSRYLPGFRNQTVACGNDSYPVPREMCIHDLLSMTSGLAYPKPGLATDPEVSRSFRALKDSCKTCSPIGTVEFANLLGKNRLEFAPGSSWMYGTSADVLGAVVEVVSGMSFGEFLKKNLFQPLDMMDTGFWVPPEKRPRFAKVYNPVDGVLREAPTDHLGISYTMEQPPAFESGGAGLVSTLLDYSHFAQMLMDDGMYLGKQIMSPATVRFFTRAELLPWQQEAMWKNWDGLTGYTYGNLMRVMARPGMSGYHGLTGEYGWDGWLGPYFSNAPEQGLTFLLGMQKQNAGTNRLTRSLRNAVNIYLQN